MSRWAARTRSRACRRHHFATRDKATPPPSRKSCRSSFSREYRPIRSRTDEHHRRSAVAATFEATEENIRLSVTRGKSKTPKREAYHAPGEEIHQHEPDNSLQPDEWQQRAERADPLVQVAECSAPGIERVFGAAGRRGDHQGPAREQAGDQQRHQQSEYKRDK